MLDVDGPHSAADPSEIERDKTNGNTHKTKA